MWAEGVRSLRAGGLGRRVAPGCAALSGYHRDWWRGDLLAGASVAAYLIPQTLAYATLAGLSPIAGLWAALPPLIIYAILGSSRHLSVGPESTTALMTAAVIAPLVVGDPARYAVYAAGMAVLVGGFCLIAGMLRLGFVASLLSEPVLVGYLAGVAAIMVVSQLGRVTGSGPLDGETLATQFWYFTTHLSDIHWPTTLLGVSVLVLILVLQRLAPGVPGPLAAIVLATIAAGVVASDHGVATVGEFPVAWPTAGVPRLAPDEVVALAVPALGIAVVGFCDNMLTARAFAARVGEYVDANAELRALGMCNLAVGLTHGFPVSSSGSRTALAVAAGARTQMYSVAAMVIVLVVLAAGVDVISLIPSAALGAVVVFAATKLVDTRQFVRLARFRRSELLLAVATTLAVGALGVLPGVLAAVTLTILDLLRRLARAHDSIQGFVPGLAGMHDVDDYPDAFQLPGLVVYRYDAPLCFANAEDFHRRALQAMDTSGSPVRWFVLNTEANVEVDLTALDALDRVRAECDRRGVVFALARVKQDLREALRAVGLINKIGEDRVFLTLPTAVAAFKQATKVSG